MTPMLAQYQEIKRNHEDAILFYRMGDFYEMFFADALAAAPVLEVQLTSRDKSASDPIPMCGVPYHAASGYVQKLVAKGFKVAICEQMEDPSTTKGLVKRQVVRVITPGMISDPELVSAEQTSWCAAIDFNAETGEIWVGLFDLLAGRLRVGQVGSPAELLELFLREPPQECLCTTESRNQAWFESLRKYFPKIVFSYRDSYFAGGLGEKRVRGAFEAYVKETQKISDLSFLAASEALFPQQRMQLDSATLASLEILEGEHSLCSVVDRTHTPMGRRELKRQLASPSMDLKQTTLRLEAVEALYAARPLSEKLEELLKEMRDLERLSGKTAMGLSSPRDLIGIREVLEKLPDLKKLLQGSKSSYLKTLGKTLVKLEALSKTLQEALEDDPPAVLREGGIIRESFHPEVKEYRHLSRDAKEVIAQLETRERERTRIPTLKVKFSRVFGYTIEVTKTHVGKVPTDYIRKQTIANGERYITEELKTLEEKVVTADHRLKTLEERLFLQVRSEVAEEARELLLNARLLADLDVLVCFARVAKERGYQKPTLHEGYDLSIREGRHPVVESLLPLGTFVPNTIEFDEKACRTLVITGPNMGGKSTIMRQAALIQILAQCGSYVPAASAHLPMVDAVFTRIGSSDDLARGRSTFMVEMTEVARILQSASGRSLVLIDEIGRGTSTYDGLSLAWSILEYLHKEVGAKTLFATHFHELTLLEHSFRALKNANVLVETWEGRIAFLYKLAPGGSSQSYGIEVAESAHLPAKVLSRARALLMELESHSQQDSRARRRALQSVAEQMAFTEGWVSPESRAQTEAATE